MQVNVTLKRPGAKLEHQGIKIEFVGQIGEYLHSFLYVMYHKLQCLIHPEV